MFPIFILFTSCKKKSFLAVWENWFGLVSLNYRKVAFMKSKAKENYQTKIKLSYSWPDLRQINN